MPVRHGRKKKAALLDYGTRPIPVAGRPRALYSLLDPRLRQTPALVAALIGRDARDIARGRWPLSFPPEETLGFLAYQLRKMGLIAPVAEGEDHPETLDAEFTKEDSRWTPDDGPR
jgi:hypothetical protein